MEHDLCQYTLCSKSKTISKIEASLKRDQGPRYKICKEIEGYSFLLKSLDRDVGKWRKLWKANLKNPEYLKEYTNAKYLRRTIVQRRKKLNSLIKDHYTYEVHLLFVAVNAYNERMKNIVNSKDVLKENREISPEYKEYSEVRVELGRTTDKLKTLEVEKHKLEEVREYLMNAVNERMEQIRSEETQLKEHLFRLRECLLRSEFSNFRKIDKEFPQWSYYFKRLVNQYDQLRGYIWGHRFLIYSL